MIRRIVINNTRKKRKIDRIKLAKIRGTVRNRNERRTKLRAESNKDHSGGGRGQKIAEDG